MKKALLLLCILCSCLCQAQTETGITTEEEYNYMTKGYKLQIDGGLDMKKGYITDEPTDIKVGDYSFKFLPLARVSGKDSILVGYIVKARSLTWDNTYWYGIPFGDTDLLNRTFNAIRALDLPMTQAFFRAYMQFETIEAE